MVQCSIWCVRANVRDCGFVSGSRPPNSVSGRIVRGVAF